MAPNPSRISSPSDVADQLAAMAEDNRKNALFSAGRERRGHAGALLFGEEWHEVGAAGEPAPGGNWGSWAGYAPAGFYRDSSGFVHLRGSMHTPGTNTTPSTNVLFVLPLGYRPPFRQRHMCLLFDLNESPSGGVLSIEVDGSVTYQSFASGTRGISLDNQGFRVI